jgi:hypothetical protein
MTRWLPPIFKRMGATDAAGAICDRTDCTAHAHGATYTAETANTETGEVRRARLCTKAAAMLAYSLQVAFPPGPQKESAWKS